MIVKRRIVRFNAFENIYQYLFSKIRQIDLESSDRITAASVF